ncbi:MAG: hypothetical protein CFH21_00850 [Alphaproteobacteria bacterium MarineAlpha5_Bin11]|nr:MAG: hypothetical protein CFH21_00850 [Alphaproteobacteria bacterium MarineAlpha5_Bin11]|tara:strand:- start:2402 stop:3304 length:903 start_codon:yes stop_codon:yes gene_type:complete
MNENIANIKDLLQDYTIETTPKVYKKIEELKSLLPKKTWVYITYLPDEDPRNIIETAKKIKEEGLEPIPHLPARTIENFHNLEKYIGSLSEISGVNKILIIGGSSSQKGNISSSIEVLRTGLTEKFQFTDIGLAGHPEGSPDINNDELDKAIIDKNNFSKNTNANLFLVTQFFFEASSFITWEKHLNKLGNQLEIHAGLPGPANLKTLITFAKSCGIGNSLKFLSKQALNISKIASTNTPDKIINDLSNYKKSNNYSKLSKIHFYPFGGMKRTSSWVNALINNDISINNDGEIKIDSFNF